MNLEDICTWMCNLWGKGMGLGMLEELAKTVSRNSKYRKDWRPKGKICV